VLWLEDGRIKDIAQLVRDPVCGASLEADAPVTLEHERRTWYFCSGDCRRTFQQAPERFTSGAIPATAAP
jgi:Cu+-exporting ATPase